MATRKIFLLFLLAVAIAAEKCKDSAIYVTRCPRYKEMGLCKIEKKNPHVGFMGDHCRKTCKYCEEDSGCDDNSRYSNMCVTWKSNKFCEISATNPYMNFMRQHCRKTCEFCFIPCKNSNRYVAQCPVWKSYCKQSPSNSFYNFMMDHCRETCGKCNTNATTSSVPKCGLRPSERGRVIGGKHATANSWPWQIALLRFGEYFCGGTLIDAEWVLTAAHCIYGYSASSMTVVLGDHDREGFEGHEQRIQVKTIYAHPKYSPRTFSSDIALLKLSKAAILNVYVAPACLPKQDEVIPPQKLCFLTGWGKTKHPGPFGRFLQQVDLPIVPRDICRRDNNPGGTSLDITDDMICAGEGASGGIKSGCQGDSGGPFVCSNKDRWAVQGVVSWGSASCNAKLKHTVFARVSKFVDWIERTMKDN